MGKPFLGWLVVVAVAVLGWWLVAPPAERPGVARSSDHARARALSAPRSRDVPRQVPPAASAPTVARAWLTRSRRLQACAHLLSLSEDELIAHERRIAASWPDVARARGVDFDADSAERELQAVIATRLDDRGACKSLPPAEVASWWVLLERAALAGDLVAMEDYGHLVVNASARADDMFDDIDEMARRKRLAYGFLRQVAAQGNCMVSGSLERLAPDPTARYAFALVSVEVTRRFNDRHAPGLTADNVAFMQQRADRHVAGLAPDQLAQARRLSAEVIARCR